jgi:hypothetical protein
MRVPTRTRGERPGAEAEDAVAVRLAAAHARTAGWSGLALAALLVVALVLVRRIPGLADPDDVYSAFYDGGGADTLTLVGLYVVPFAGIACLWHAMATRTAFQLRRPGSWAEIPHWLHLASAVLFVCMLFVCTAAVGAVALLTRFSDAPLPGPDVARALSSTGYALVFVYGVRAAGMYMITTTGLASAAGMLPRPLAVVSYLLAVFLLVSVTFHPAILLVFPAWVLMVSTVLLVRRPTGGSP